MNDLSTKNLYGKASSINIFNLLGYTEHRLLKRLVDNNKELFSDELFFNYGFSEKVKGKGRSSKSYLFGFKDLLTLISISKNNSKNRQIKAIIMKDLIDSVEHSSLIAILDVMKNMDVDELPIDAFVYVAQERKSGRYKIGISKDPERRLKELNTGNPEQLILVHAYLAIEIKNHSEKLAHSVFNKNKLKGEWFEKNINLSLLPSYVGDK